MTNQKLIRYALSIARIREHPARSNSMGSSFLEHLESAEGENILASERSDLKNMGTGYIIYSACQGTIVGGILGATLGILLTANGAETSLAAKIAYKSATGVAGFIGGGILGTTIPLIRCYIYDKIIKNIIDERKHRITKRESHGPTGNRTPAHST